jgi:hypothetical protein
MLRIITIRGRWVQTVSCVLVIQLPGYRRTEIRNVFSFFPPTFYDFVVFQVELLTAPLQDVMR